MKTRILPPGESANVGPPAIPLIDRKDSAVVVVEDDNGVPVACVTVLLITHFEGFWVDPKYRANPGVVRALIRQAVAIPAVRGEKWVLGGAAAGDTIMPKILSGLGGAPLPATFSVLPIGEGSCLERF